MSKTYCEETHCQMFESAKKQIRAEAIDEFVNALINDGKVSAMRVLKIKEQLKEQNKDNCE